MTSELKVPTTLQQAILLFSDPKVCHDYMVGWRWGGEVVCPRCGSANVGELVKTRLVWNCKGCKKQFSVKVGTIFEDSPLKLSTWLPAVWLITNAKNGVSSHELHRALGVTQKTAWFMLHRIRYAMQQGSFEKMSGTVEADETFIGGLEKNKHEDKKLHAGRGPVGKTIVLGVLERAEKTDPEEAAAEDKDAPKSQVRAKVIQNRAEKTLQAEIKKEVSAFSELYTDAWKGYRGLSPDYIHKFVDHAVNYAIGKVHTNGLENFWTLLKRCLKGTYISVEPFHLFRYLDEEVFRFNNRGENDGGRFSLVMESVSGKRLTYEELTSSYLAYYDEVLPKTTNLLLQSS
jgi:transposase-like protein